MAKIEHEFTVVAIHGEGDRETVKALQEHRNILFNIQNAPEEAPEVMIVLRDDSHRARIELPVTNWADVETWKKLAGWDADKRHWQHGAKIKVTISG